MYKTLYVKKPSSFLLFVQLFFPILPTWEKVIFGNRLSVIYRFWKFSCSVAFLQLLKTSADAVSQIIGVTFFERFLLSSCLFVSEIHNTMLYIKPKKYLLCPNT